MGKLVWIVVVAVLVAAPLPAQHHQHHPPPAPPQEPKAPPPSEPERQGQETHEGHAAPEKKPQDEHAGHPEDAMEATKPGMEHAGHGMPGMFGPYPMSRESSGTAWQPESAPHTGLHSRRGDWHLMAHGFVNLIYDDQDGPRGNEDLFSGNMVMGMGVRELGNGKLGLRAMLSAEPWTIGDEGYPLLLQTGETADGRTPLVDRQHPHDLFMELAASYSRELSPGSAVFLYLGLPGEPALGPPAYLHRFSGMDNPEAPLGHHWLDSTHITFGVATLGWILGGVKLEGSVFTGREPDEDRADIEEPKMDSWSVRASWQPNPSWSLQASTGHLKSPEQLEPGVDTDRTTASIIYNVPRDGGNWQTTFTWGRNAKDPGETTDTWLLESALSFAQRHTLFGRVERQENDELSGHGEAGDHGEQVFDVGKLSLGYIWDAVLSDPWKAGLGALGSLALIPDELEHEYGEQPVSWMVFLRLRM